MGITVARVGARAQDLSLEAVDALKNAEKVVVHTKFCGCADWLQENGIAYDSLDDIYEEAYDFDEHADLAVERLLKTEDQNVVYCVMELTDETVKRLLETGKPIQVIGAGGDSELVARSKNACLTVSAMDIENTEISSAYDTLVREIDTRSLAGEVKLKLMAHYPDESDIFVLQKGGVAKCKLVDLDRLKYYDHTVSCLIHAEKRITKLERHDFRSLMQLVKALRDPVDGCPWDREQTHDSLKRDALEEAYELEDAIEQNDEFGIIEELGDVMFACALQIQIGIEHGEFDEIDVISGVVNKMISRHSHVFGKDEVENIDGLMNLWDKAKRAEKGLASTADEMRAVAKALPALIRAQKVAKRATKAGMEVRAADLDNVGSAEFGVKLMEMAEWARRNDIDAEKALQDAVSRYIDTVEKNM